MHSEAIKTITRLIGLILKRYGVEVDGRGNHWLWRSENQVSEVFSSRLAATPATCEKLLSDTVSGQTFFADQMDLPTSRAWRFTPTCWPATAANS